MLKSYLILQSEIWFNRIFGYSSALLVTHEFLSTWARWVILKREVLSCYWLHEGASLAGGDLSSCLRLPHTCPLLSSSSIKRCAVEACGGKETGTRSLFSVAGGGEKYLSPCIFFFSLSVFATFFKVCRDTSIHVSRVNKKSVKWEKMHKKEESDCLGDDNVIRVLPSQPVSDFCTATLWN